MVLVIDEHGRATAYYQHFDLVLRGKRTVDRALPPRDVLALEEKATLHKRGMSRPGNATKRRPNQSGP